MYCKSDDGKNMLKNFFSKRMFSKKFTIYEFETKKEKDQRKALEKDKNLIILEKLKFQIDKTQLISP